MPIYAVESTQMNTRDISFPETNTVQDTRLENKYIILTSICSCNWSFINAFFIHFRQQIDPHIFYCLFCNGQILKPTVDDCLWIHPVYLVHYYYYYYCDSH